MLGAVVYMRCSKPIVSLFRGPSSRLQDSCLILTAQNILNVITKPDFTNHLAATLKVNVCFMLDSETVFWVFLQKTSV